MQINPLAASSVAGAFASQPASSQQPFSGLFREAVNNVQQLESKASSTVEGLLSGSGVDVHTAMIATEKSDMAFELALSVRSKAVSAYQAMMNMQF
ncbi:flagellar hook-basal body complex protein FliE [Acidipila rosea]|uniref:Flagellar hook-basal body complex protein FliE n=1 Tax=Acidipila rosea TaxID=768535 RepID=A0A4R1LE20_9BACT|nr:flagellar hook-basal body complex protein FliE [Acidipila rosea]MBW4028438.1 flagellar hook-basal body complex protein FliE [Acidobacteriota bacterium]MBW4046058.1 flagellar hook-basal body complex protein FliE [Acidobacteriota bacterium]TCK75073.1 flagellar hook-basal body complex protein FliE [Acidipila rosea]